MPFFIPALFGLASGLAGASGNKNKQTQTTESTRDETSNTTGVSNDVFNRISSQGFAPEFGGQANNLIAQIFGRSQGANLDPEQLRIQELAARNRANTQANNVFQSALGSGFSRGLANSPASAALARGLTEGFRGNAIGDIAGNFAQQRFQMPVLQEQINASQRDSLLNLLNLLPRTQTINDTGTSTRTQNTTANIIGNSNTFSTASRGNPIFNGLSAGLVGFGATGGFGPDLQQQLFGQGGNVAGRGSSTNAFINPNIFNQLPGLQNPFQTPGFNPNANTPTVRF